MSYQNISYNLPANDLDDIRTAIDVINTKLPFLVSLSSDERQALFKLGPKSTDFVQDANSASTAFPNILPASFDTAEFNKDTSLFKALSEVKLLLDSVTEKVNQTYMAVGSEAMNASLEVYAYVQTAKNKTPGLESVADKLKDRFKSQGPGKKKKPMPVSNQD